MGEQYVMIQGWPCREHSVYKNWTIYRAFDLATGRGKMRYYAVSPEGILRRGDNLQQAKDAVTEEVGSR